MDGCDDVDHEILHRETTHRAHTTLRREHLKPSNVLSRLSVKLVHYSTMTANCFLIDVASALIGTLPCRGHERDRIHGFEGVKASYSQEDKQAVYEESRLLGINAFTSMMNMQSRSNKW